MQDRTAAAPIHSSEHDVRCVRQAQRVVTRWVSVLMHTIAIAGKTG